MGRPGIGFVRRARLSDDEVASWCDDLARLMRSGSSLASALRSAAPGPALAPIVAPIGLALDRGDSVAGATRRVAWHGASVDLALGVVRACADLGGPAAQPLDRTAATLPRRAADLAERQVHSAQARLSAMVLTLLPLAALALLVATSPPSRTAVLGLRPAVFCPSAREPRSTPSAGGGCDGSSDDRHERHRVLDGVRPGSHCSPAAWRRNVQSRGAHRPPRRHPWLAPQPHASVVTGSRLMVTFVATAAVVALAALAGVAMAGATVGRVRGSSLPGVDAGVRSPTARRSPPRSPMRSSSSC